MESVAERTPEIITMQNKPATQPVIAYKMILHIINTALQSMKQGRSYRASPVFGSLLGLAGTWVAAASIFLENSVVLSVALKGRSTAYIYLAETGTPVFIERSISP